MTEINRAEIDKVHAVIAPHVRETPVVMAAAEDFGLTGAPIAFKLELLQHAGVFKPRGAFANLLTARRAEGRRGGGLRRQSRRGGRVRGQAARHPGQDLHSDRRLARQDRADPLLWRGAGGGGRALRRRAGA